MTNILLIRHCSATGQDPDAPLTLEGLQQAKELIHYLKNYSVSKIISSPYLRAVQTIEPFAKHFDIPIHLDARLQERILSSSDLPDWMEKLEETFNNFNLKFEGGESSAEALNRIEQCLKEITVEDDSFVVVVTHGNLASLLLTSLDPNFGFEGWRNMPNPAIYKLSQGGSSKVHLATK